MARSQARPRKEEIRSPSSSAPQPPSSHFNCSSLQMPTLKINETSITGRALVCHPCLRVDSMEFRVKSLQSATEKLRKSAYALVHAHSYECRPPWTCAPVTNTAPGQRATCLKNKKALSSAEALARTTKMFAHLPVLLVLRLEFLELLLSAFTHFLPLCPAPLYLRRNLQGRVQITAHSSGWGGQNADAGLCPARGTRGRPIHPDFGETQEPIMSNAA